MSPGALTRALVLPLLAGAALAGCTTQMEQVSRVGQDPAFTRVEDPTTEESYQRVRMPMPNAQPERYQPNSLWRSGARSFFKDQRAGRVGDLLTVQIEIDNTANLNNSTETERSADNEASVDAFFGLTGVFEDVIGLIPGSDPDAGNLVDVETSNETEADGSINRGEQINLQIAAIVTQTLPNGNLVIQGRQETRVNAELRELFITGIVRPEDITSENTVDYNQIAEARLAYGGRGTLSDLQRPRYGQQLYEVVTPF